MVWRRARIVVARGTLGVGVRACVLSRTMECVASWGMANVSFATLLGKLLVPGYSIVSLRWLDSIGEGCSTKLCCVGCLCHGGATGRFAAWPPSVLAELQRALRFPRTWKSCNAPCSAGSLDLGVHSPCSSAGGTGMLVEVTEAWGRDGCGP